jgi:pimeloyl-ACP methyl ester carboxylesterase
MSAMERRRIALSTGVSLDVTVGGDPRRPAILFLHGFPESSETWRWQMADLASDHYVVAPDQRGFAGSDKPAGVAAYRTNRLVEDVLALADALGLERFTLAAHDWGGAVAWALALKHPARLERLIIANAPHPLLYQKALFEDPEQRAAGQYVRDYRRPEKAEEILADLDGFFDRELAPHVAPDLISEEERARYLREWSEPGAAEGMFNWYKASLIVVPAMDDESSPPSWIAGPFPRIEVRTLVIWGRRDPALLPSLLEGLDDLVPGARVETLDAGHFVTWEAPNAVTNAIRDFLER